MAATPGGSRSSLATASEFPGHGERLDGEGLAAHMSMPPEEQRRSYVLRDIGRYAPARRQ